MQKPQEASSLQSTSPDTPDRPNFLFFGAVNTIKTLSPNWFLLTSALPATPILSGTNDTLIEFNADNTRFNNEEGWFIFSGKLENGLYFLKANGTEDPQDLPFLYL